VGTEVSTAEAFSGPSTALLPVAAAEVFTFAAKLENEADIFEGPSSFEEAGVVWSVDAFSESPALPVAVTGVFIFAAKFENDADIFDGPSSFAEAGVASAGAFSESSAALLSSAELLPVAAAEVFIFAAKLENDDDIFEGPSFEEAVVVWSVGAFSESPSLPVAAAGAFIFAAKFEKDADIFDGPSSFAEAGVASAGFPLMSAALIRFAKLDKEFFARSSWSFGSLLSPVSTSFEELV